MSVDTKILWPPPTRIKLNKFVTSHRLTMFSIYFDSIWLIRIGSKDFRRDFNGSSFGFDAIRRPNLHGFWFADTITNFYRIRASCYHNLRHFLFLDNDEMLIKSLGWKQKLSKDNKNRNLSILNISFLRK